jgi:hypothetical protein
MVPKVSQFSPLLRLLIRALEIEILNLRACLRQISYSPASWMHYYANKVAFFLLNLAKETLSEGRRGVARSIRDCPTHFLAYGV